MSQSRMPTESLSIEEIGERIDREGNSWSPNPGTAAVVNFAFRATAPDYNDSDSDVQGTFARFNSAYIVLATQALGLWSDVADITFQRVGSGTSGDRAYSDEATILFGNYTSATDGSAGFSFDPAPDSTAPDEKAGDIWINTDGASVDPVIGAYEFFTFVHEIGHAIGLAHPGDYNAGPGVTLTYEDNAEFKEDTRQYSAMSYFSEEHTGGDFLITYPMAPMVADIYAIQRIYGANTTTRTGDTIYGYNSNTANPIYHLVGIKGGVFAIWDAGGDDTLDASGGSRSQIIDLRPGEFSSIGRLTNNIAMAVAPPGGADGLDYFVENAIGGREADKITGNERDNLLEGRNGNDTIDGGERHDSLDGGDGADVLDGVDGNDRLVGDEGNDTLTGGVGVDRAFFSGDLLEYEFTLHGSSLEMTLVHSGGSTLDGTDRLSGIEWAEFNGKLYSLAKTTVITGTSRGEDIWGYTIRNDYIRGGGGDDSINGDTTILLGPGDQPAPGNDTLVGEGGNDELFDTWGHDRMLGGPGDDFIRGGNDDKADFLDGGPGNDVINVVARHDRIDDVVLGGPGNDGLGVDGIYGRHLEGEAGNDRLRGGSGTDTLEGGSDNDYLEGGAGANLLVGGSGNDTLETGDTLLSETLDGGAGSDSIRFVGVGDVVLGGNGLDDFAYIDRSASTLDFRLDISNPDRVQILADGTRLSGIERLDFQGGSGNDVLKGTSAGILSSQFRDKLTGWAGNDVLDGGEGADTLSGGQDNDVYYVDRPADLVIERAGEGVDRVYASDSFRLVGTEVEILAAQDVRSKDDIDLTGDDAANLIIGNAGKNTLIGGLGNDTLSGGSGDDTYHVNWSLDRVVDGAGKGIDRVITEDGLPMTSYALHRGSEIEFLIAQNSGAIDLAGNEFDNTIIGNDAHNRIDGGAGIDRLKGGRGEDTLDGGEGADIMVGGGSDDLYMVDASRDVVTEAAGAGSDTVLASASYALDPGVEVLTLTGARSINGTGNSLANVVTGNEGKNVLDGLAGPDTLNGGGGADRFLFSTKLSLATQDVIQAYNPAEDTIVISRSVVTGLDIGRLAAGAFVISKLAVDDTDRIIYNSDAGRLLFDADGARSRFDPIEFAVVDRGLSLTNTDFVVA